MAKWHLLSGGSSGIGLGIARAFVNARMKVVIGYRTQAHLDEAMRYFRDSRALVHSINVDVTDPAAMRAGAEETVKKFGAVHVLVNNARVFAHAHLSDTTIEDFNWLIDVNVRGVFNGVTAFLPHILANGDGGQIVTASSGEGIVTYGGSSAYAVSKFAVTGMMESLRSELAPRNIGVSLYFPGILKSNILESQRNRPSNLRETGYNKEKALLDSDRRLMEASTTEPLQVGEMVLNGIIKNKLYIVLFNGFDAVVRERNEALISSVSTDLRSTPLTADRTNVHTEERVRNLCEQEGAK